MDRKRPVIGISAYDVPVDFGQWRELRCVLVPEGYVASVVRAGGVPVIVPPTDGCEQLADEVDALVFTGGSDINPAVYGQVAHPESAGFYDHRDRAELELMRVALRRGMPVLGICRGMQLLNVARGGDLVQHLDGDLHKGAPGTYTVHRVEPLEGSRLAAILGTDVRTHSCHHQAPGRLGDGLEVSAAAEDGTVEGIEDPAARFTIGVLWHPEEDALGGGPLFRELVEQATTYRRAAA
jgi:putative glutamine amidotransferase